MSPRLRSGNIQRSCSSSPHRYHNTQSKKSKHSRYRGGDLPQHSCSITQQMPSSPQIMASPGRHMHYSNSKSFSKSPTPVRRHRRSRSSTRSRTSNGERARSSRANPMQSQCIGVFGLNVHTTQHKIRDIFSKFGAIERIHVVIDAQSGRSRGFCFIYYYNLTDARAAKDACCGLEIDGRRVRVDYSITQRPHTPTPGVYMGRHLSYRKSYERSRDEYHHKRHYSPIESPYSRGRSSHYTNNHRRRHYERSRSRSYSPRYARY